MTAPDDSNELNDYTKTPVAPTDQVIFSDANDSNQIKRDDAQNLGTVITTNVEAYSASKTYNVGDVVRIFDVENFICITDITVAEPFDGSKWKPVRLDLETAAVDTDLISFLGITNIVGITASNLVTVTVGAAFADLFESTETVSISGTTNYDTTSPQTITKTSSTTFTYSTPSPSQTPESAGVVTKNSHVWLTATTGFIVDNTIPDTPVTTLITLAAQNLAYTSFTPEPTAGAVVLFVDDAGTLTLENASELITERSTKLQLGFAVVSPTNNIFLSSQGAPDPLFKTTLSNRTRNMSAGGSMFPGGLITEGSSGRTINVATGFLQFPGSGWSTDRNQPDGFTVTARTPTSAEEFLQLFTFGTGQDDAAVATAVTGNDVDLTLYNPNNTFSTPVPDESPFQILRVYVADNFTMVYYGVAVYESIESALGSLNTEAFNDRTLSKLGAFRGYIIASKDVTSWSTATEGVDYQFLSKVEEFSIDRGNPQNTTNPLTQDQINARDALQSTGMIDGGDVSFLTRTISNIEIDGSSTEITTTQNHEAEVGDKILVTGTGLAIDDETVTVTSIFDTTTIITDFTGSAESGTTGTTTNQNGIDITTGQGQIDNHSSMPFVLTDVNWSDESINLGTFTGADLSKGIIYITKNISGTTIVISTDDTALTSEQDRTLIKLAVIRTTIGLTEDIIRGISNLRTPLVAPVLTTKDFTNPDFQIKSGLTVTENATLLQIDHAAGDVAAFGLNFLSNQNNPNVVSVSAVVNESYILIKRDGEITGSLVTAPDNAQFDNNGTLTTVANNMYSAKRLWFDPANNLHFMQYGTAEYTNSQIQSGEFRTEFPPDPVLLSEFAFVHATLIIRQDSATWAANPENEILQGDQTGGSFTSSAGGSAGISSLNALTITDQFLAAGVGTGLDISSVTATHSFTVDINQETSKSVLVAADEVLIADSASSFAIKKTTIPSIQSPALVNLDMNNLNILDVNQIKTTNSTTNFTGLNLGNLERVAWKNAITGAVIGFDTFAGTNTGYVDGQTVTLTGATGTLFSGIAVVPSSPGAITAVNVVDAGTNYVDAENVTLTTTASSNATAHTRVATNQSFILDSNDVLQLVDNINLNSMRVHLTQGRIHARNTAGTFQIAVGAAFPGTIVFEATTAHIDFRDIHLENMEFIQSGPNGVGIPTTGFLRLENMENITFRNNASDGDIAAISVNSSDQVVLQSSNYLFSTTQADFTGSTLINTVVNSTITGVSGITGLGTQTISLDMGAQNIDDAGVVNLDRTDLNIDTNNEITISRSYHRVNPFSGTSDNLQEINGGTIGDVLVLGVTDDLDTINVTEAGNIRLSNDPIILNNTLDSLTLIYNGTFWIEISSVNGGS